MKLTACILGFALVLIFLFRARGQEKETATDRAHTQRVFVGQSLQDAMDALRNCDIKFGERDGFAFARTDPDRTHLYFNLDPNHADVCAYFSKSKSTITGISLVFYPSRKLRSKSGDAWVSAKEIVIKRDRSYSVTFAAPITAEDLRRVEERTPTNQFPQLPPSK